MIGIDMVSCFFKWDAKNHSWELAKTTPYLEKNYRQHRDDANDWCYKKKWIAKDEDYESTPIMGRLVLTWTIVGIRLELFMPPTFCDWLNPMFLDGLCQDYKWHHAIADGYSARETTANEAERLIAEKLK